MDYRFVKSDKIDQKLRNELFKDYYSNARFLENNKISFVNDENVTYYNKKYKVLNNAVAFVIVEYFVCGKFSYKSYYLLPEEIDRFCFEHCFLFAESETSFLTCCPKEQHLFFNCNSKQWTQDS